MAENGQMKKTLRNFVWGLFEDDVHEPCMGRFALFLGLVLTPITAVWSLDIEGEVTMWEAAVRCCPALVGLIAYVFTRLYESREWIAEHASKFVKKKTE